MVGLFLLSIIVIALVSRKKIKDFFEILIELLKIGAKLEFSSKAGLFSLITVFLVAGIVAVIILVHEAKSFLFDILRIEYKSEDYISIGILATLGAIFFNFIFIALIRKMDTKDRTP